jgi:aspartate-semialdehyde dehydrogenase
VKKIKIGIVGATGLVGLELQRLLPQRLRPATYDLHLFASRARDGVHEFAASQLLVDDCDYLLNATEKDVAEKLRRGLKSNQVLIDNSSAFRMDPEVPLVVPEVNGDILQSAPQVVANPNCTAILLCVALNALKDFGPSRVVVATYQSASGAGIKGLEELDAGMKAAAEGRETPRGEVFKYPLALNVFSHNTSIRPEASMGAGYNDEEWKVVEESRKILGVHHLPISATCIRVPSRRSHAEAVTVDLKMDVPLEKLREAFAGARGVKVVDDWENNHFPMPLEAQDQDLVLVGRIRKDVTLGRTMHFFLAGDQIRKGAATNALQILEEILRQRAIA